MGLGLGRPSEQELFATQNQICSRNLLEALIANHGAPSDCLPPLDELPPPPPPPPVVELELAMPRPQCPQWFSIVGEVDPPQPKIKDIKKAAAKHFGISLVEIESARRTARIVYPRQIVMCLARSLTKKSLPEIGRQLGDRDHTTVLHGARKIEADMMRDWTVAYDVALVEALI